MFTEDVVYFKIHAKRSKSAFGIVIGQWRGVLVSDDYSTYIRWENGRQTCLSHLLRAARAVAESGYKHVAACGEWLQTWLRSLIKKKGMKQSVADIEALKSDYLAHTRKFIEGENGQLKVVGEPKKLLDRILEEFDAVTYFLSHPEVEPTNNYAELCIRSFVAARKMFLGATSENGETCLERCVFLSIWYSSSISSGHQYCRTRTAVRSHADTSIVGSGQVTIQYPLENKTKNSPQYFLKKILDDYIRRGGL